MNKRAREERVKERWEGWWWEGRMAGGIEHGRVEWKVNERSNLAEEIQILEFANFQLYWKGYCTNYF